MVLIDKHDVYQRFHSSNCLPLVVEKSLRASKHQQHFSRGNRFDLLSPWIWPQATGCNSHVTQLCQLISHQRQQRRDHQTRWTRFLSFPMSHEIENKWGNVERSTFSWSSGSNQQAHLCRPNMHRWLVFGLFEFQFLVTKLPCPIFDCIMYRSHPWPLNSWLPGKYTLQISQISKTFVSSQWYSASTISQWTRAWRPE